jgi:hypothetical protein
VAGDARGDDDIFSHFCPGPEGIWGTTGREPNGFTGPAGPSEALQPARKCAKSLIFGGFSASFALTHGCQRL